jgi:hypothetical protein
MEVPFSNDKQTRIVEAAATCGQGAGQFVRELVKGYLDDLADVRDILSSRYDDIKSERVEAIDGEEAFLRLRRKSEERRANVK